MGGTTYGVTFAGGSAIDLSSQLKLYAELGFMNEWNRGYDSTEADPDREIKSHHYPGGYAGIGIGYRFGTESAPD